MVVHLIGLEPMKTLAYRVEQRGPKPHKANPPTIFAGPRNLR